MITGGYGGIGFELAKILYEHNANLVLAGRSTEKGTQAVAELKKLYPHSKGSARSLKVDLADLPTIKPAAKELLSSTPAIHGLTLNAGVMHTPAGLKNPQGWDLQLATNVLGSYIFYSALRPALARDAKGTSPRVTWASSLTAEVGSPKNGGIAFDQNGAVSQTLSPEKQYAQTKVGNSYLAAVLARRDAADGIEHLSFNPGNLLTDLQRHMSLVQYLFLKYFLLYPAKNGAWTELFAQLHPITSEQNGSYVAPWGRIGTFNRKDLKEAIADRSPTGISEKFVDWVDKVTEGYR